MKRVYTILDYRDGLESGKRTLDFPMPFEENVTAFYKREYDAFLKSVNHQTRTIEIHSRYDSGKGCTIIPANKSIGGMRKAFDAFLISTSHSITFSQKRQNYVVCKTKNPDKVQIFKNGTVDSNGNVAGYSQGVFSTKGVLRFFRERGFTATDIYDAQAHATEEKRIIAAHALQVANSVQLHKIAERCTMDNIATAYLNGALELLDAMQLRRLLLQKQGEKEGLLHTHHWVLNLK